MIYNAGAHVCKIETIHVDSKALDDALLFQTLSFLATSIAGLDLLRTYLNKLQKK